MRCSYYVAEIEACVFFSTTARYVGVASSTTASLDQIERHRDR